jgi:hypothetical protein
VFYGNDEYGSNSTIDFNDLGESIKTRPGLFGIKDNEIYSNMKPEEKDFVNRLIKAREQELYERLAAEFAIGGGNSATQVAARIENVELNSKGI